MLKRILLLVILIITIGYCFLCWNLSELILTTGSSIELTKSRIEQVWGSTLEEKLSTLPTPKDFSFESFDKTVIRGKHFVRSETPTCAIITAHGWSSTWAGMLKYVPVIDQCDCDLIMYDHRAHGESGGAYPTGGIKEGKDLVALTDWVEKELGLSAQQIGWVGASWGGAAVLNAGADKKRVAFIIADSPFQDWYSAIFERAIRDYGSWIKLVSSGVMQTVSWRADIDYKEASALLAASNIEEPVLLIHSQGDSETASTQSVNISKHLKHPLSVFHHTVWGGDHTKDVLINTNKFKKVVNDFLKENNFIPTLKASQIEN